MAYRPTKPVPWELLTRCRLQIQESSFPATVALLHRLLVTDTSVSTDDNPIPAFVPTNHYLRLIATFIVHPALNTRTEEADRKKASNDALHYLRTLNSIVGPVNAQLGSAFHFADSSGSLARAQRRNKRQEAEASGDTTPTNAGEDEFENVQIAMANEGSLFAKAETFWHIVGWAFNCAVKHKTRWKRWRILLDFMITMLEDDLKERGRMWEERKVHYEAQGIDTRHVRREEIEDSIIMQYVAQPGFKDRGSKRRIMRAIFADGSQKALGEFPELYRRETEELKKKAPAVKPKRKLNLDEGDFGDYDTVMGEADDPDEKPENNSENGPRKTARRAKPPARGAGTSKRTAEAEDAGRTLSGGAITLEAFGGWEAFVLRRRLLVLLSVLSMSAEYAFCDLEDLLDLYCEFIRPLPMSVFSMLIFPTGRSDPHLFDPFVQEQLCRMLLRPLLSSANRPYENSDLTQLKLQKYYLPFAANTSSMPDNAKVSLLVESLSRHVRVNVRAGGLTGGEDFCKAVEDGCQARGVKAQLDNRSRAEHFKDEEATAVEWLVASRERLEFIIASVSAEDDA